MYIVCKRAWRIKNMTYFIIKLRFVGISQADWAGLENAPRWAKIGSKSFKTKTCLDIVILSLYIYILYSHSLQHSVWMLAACQFWCHVHGYQWDERTQTHVFAWPTRITQPFLLTATRPEVVERKTGGECDGWATRRLTGRVFSGPHTREVL